MNKNKILGQVRHILSAIGLYLVATGKIAEPGMIEAVGAIMMIIGHVWSWFSPEKKEAS